METKPTIYNLADLTNALNEVEHREEYPQLFNKIRFTFKDIEHLCFWDADNYSRINIGQGKNYELVLICWENNQQTLIHHHHAVQACTYIIKGEITEKIFHPINGSGKHVLKGEKILIPRKVFCLDQVSSDQHQLINSFNGRSVSLHLYVK
jgi:cysteine dioxygenase